MKERTVEVVFIVVIFMLIVLFAKDPDVMDVIITRLSGDCLL